MFMTYVDLWQVLETLPGATRTAVAAATQFTAASSQKAFPILIQRILERGKCPMVFAAVWYRIASNALSSAL